MQKVLFPEGLVYDGEAVRASVTCLSFKGLAMPRAASLLALCSYRPTCCGKRKSRRITDVRLNSRLHGFCVR